MSSKKIRLIIILQLICLIVIIGFQTKWINNAYELKKEQFDRTTIEAMNKAVEKLSSQDVITFITSTIDNCRNLCESNIDNIDNFTDTLVQSSNFFDISKKTNIKSDDKKIKIVLKKVT